MQLCRTRMTNALNCNERHVSPNVYAFRYPWRSLEAALSDHILFFVIRLRGPREDGVWRFQRAHSVNRRASLLFSSGGIFGHRRPYTTLSSWGLKDLAIAIPGR